MKIVVLGDGLLGKEIVSQTGWDYISRKKDNIDITQVETWAELLLPYDVIVNCIAYTNTYDINKKHHWDINYKAVSILVDYCNNQNKKLVHISTDYVYTNSVSNASENDVPIHGDNWYSYTKLLADAYIELKSKDYLICRGTHKPTPFPYFKAWVDQFGNFDYVNVIASYIIKLIKENCQGLYNIGTQKKSIHELALKTKPDVLPALKPKHAPGDVTMDTNKMGNVIKRIN